MNLMKLNVRQVKGTREAMTIQDWAAQRCTISYRAPELFNVESHCIIDERTDIWVRPCFILSPSWLVCVVSCCFLKVLWIIYSPLLFCRLSRSSHSAISHLAVCFTA